MITVHERPDLSLRPAADGAGHVTGRGGWPTARQDEFLEPRQIGVEAIEVVLEPHRVLAGDDARTRDAQLAAEVEEVVLHLGEAVPDVIGH